jgi:hypothetical protein
VCGSNADLLIPVKDGKVDYRLYDFPLKFNIADDGNFGATVLVGKLGRRSMGTEGKISDQLLEADVEVKSVSGAVSLLCTYHWSLKRQ